MYSPMHIRSGLPHRGSPTTQKSLQSRGQLLHTDWSLFHDQKRPTPSPVPASLRLRQTHHIYWSQCCQRVRCAGTRWYAYVGLAQSRRRYRRHPGRVRCMELQHTQRDAGLGRRSDRTRRLARQLEGVRKSFATVNESMVSSSYRYERDNNHDD